MRIAVTGSVTTAGGPQTGDAVAGEAARIALGLGLLGLRPVLVGAAHHGFGTYRRLLEWHHVDTGSVDTGPRTDSTPARTEDWRDSDLASAAARAGVPALVAVAPDAPEAMMRRTRACTGLGVPFAAAPARTPAVMDRDAVRSLLAGPRYLFTDAEESVLIQERSGLTEQQILGRVGTWVTTDDTGGVQLREAGRFRLEVKALTPESPPRRLFATAAGGLGAGAAFRTGFLAAAAAGLRPERAAQLGCGLAANAPRRVAARRHLLDRARLSACIRDAYGVAAADELAAAMAVLW